MEQSPELGLQPDASRYTWARFLEDIAARHGDQRALSFQPSPEQPWRETSFSDLEHQARELALEVAALDLGARDVATLHREALAPLLHTAAPERARAVVAAGETLLIAVLGHLADRYRVQGRGVQTLRPPADLADQGTSPEDDLGLEVPG